MDYECQNDSVNKTMGEQGNGASTAGNVALAPGIHWPLIRVTHILSRAPKLLRVVQVILIFNSVKGPECGFISVLIHGYISSAAEEKKRKDSRENSMIEPLN